MVMTDDVCIPSLAVKKVHETRPFSVKEVCAARIRCALHNGNIAHIYSHSSVASGVRVHTLNRKIFKCNRSKLAPPLRRRRRLRQRVGGQKALVGFVFFILNILLRQCIDTPSAGGEMRNIILWWVASWMQEEENLINSFISMWNAGVFL